MKRTDIYPTRKSNEFKIIDRFTPCAYDCPPSLTNLEFQKYLNDGYLILKNFYSRGAISRAKETAEKIFNGEIKCYTNSEPKINQVRSALNVHIIDGIKQTLSRALIEIASHLLNSPVYIHQSRINYKAGKEANGWNWHSDFETWHSKDGMPDMNCFTAVVALEDNTIENGCIKFIPKSQNKFVCCPSIGEVKPEDEFSEQKEGVPSDDIISEICEQLNSYIVSVECSAGDLILFDCNLLHCSGANVTEGKRTNLYFVFNSINNQLQDPFSGDAHRPEEMGCTKPQIL